MEREIKLLDYLPEIFKSIREYRLLSEIESPEIARLYAEVERLLQNSFIETADLQGIKRWEQLIGIQPESQDLEERRTAILGHWNRSLPYTMTRLQEYLDVLAGGDGYQIILQPQNYYLEVLAKDQALAVLRAIRSLVKAMIPANLLFCLADRVPTTVLQSIKSKSGLIIQGSFYPRYNLTFLILDGSWSLNGEYSLDGYKAGQTVDFYPVRVQISGFTKASLTLKATPKVRSYNRQQIAYFYRLTIQSPALANIRYNLGLRSASTVVQLVDIRAINHYKSQYKQQITSATAATSKAIVNGQPKIARRIVFRSKAVQQVNYSSRLDAEKNLWYLDGSTLLDGNRQLDANIFHYEL